MVCIEGNVYVMGGRDGGSGSYLKSAEMYRDDVPARQWRPGAAVMSEVRSGLIGCAAVCIEGNVYVVGGGSDSANKHASMECYDPIAREPEWRTLPSMSNPRWYCAAMACQCDM